MRHIKFLSKHSSFDDGIAAQESGSDCDRSQAPVRDDEQAAQDLSVFCVSAHAYQILTDNFQRELIRREGVDQAEDTGIPKLRDHARNCMDDVRARKKRAFLTRQLFDQIRIDLRAEASRGTNLRNGASNPNKVFLEAQFQLLQKVGRCPKARSFRGCSLRSSPANSRQQALGVAVDDFAFFLVSNRVYKPHFVFRTVDKGRISDVRPVR